MQQWWDPGCPRCGLDDLCQVAVAAQPPVGVGAIHIPACRQSAQPAQHHQQKNSTSQNLCVHLQTILLGILEFAAMSRSASLAARAARGVNGDHIVTIPCKVQTHLDELNPSV
jgi:hypothetical protein